MDAKTLRMYQDHLERLRVQGPLVVPCPHVFTDEPEDRDRTCAAALLPCRRRRQKGTYHPAREELHKAHVQELRRLIDWHTGLVGV